jgi:hypothetical protein
MIAMAAPASGPCGKRVCGLILSAAAVDKRAEKILAIRGDLYAHVATETLAYFLLPWDCRACLCSCMKKIP